MGKVVMNASVSVDGFVAAENDDPGPIFEWLVSGDVPLDDSGVLKVSQASFDYVRPYWDEVGVTIAGRHAFDITDGWDGTPPSGIDHVVVVSHRGAPEGWNLQAPLLGTLPDDFPYSRFKLIRFDVRAGTAAFAPGVTLRLAPFFGSIGVAPSALVRRVSSGPPGPHTGNLDNKELVAGSTLYLPVHVPGALLSLGDAHAMQGDGEVTLTALETSVRGTVQVLVRKNMRLNWPRAETPTHYIVMGLNNDLDDAARLATREMIEFLVSEKHMTRDEAYLLTSIAADLRVTQLVDGTKGIHAMIAKSVFTN